MKTDTARRATKLVSVSLWVFAVFDLIVFGSALKNPAGFGAFAWLPALVAAGTFSFTGWGLWHRMSWSRYTAITLLAIAIFSLTINVFGAFVSGTIGGTGAADYNWIGFDFIILLFDVALLVLLLFKEVKKQFH